MSRSQYRLNSFRSWNPFQDNSICHEEPKCLQNATNACPYPSPISMTASSSASMPDENDQNSLRSYPIKAQRHPLPARPPAEVCLGDESRSSIQADQSHADDSQQTTPVEHERVLRPIGSSDPAQILEHPDTAYIDPGLLTSFPSPNVQSVATTANYRDSDLMGNSFSPESPYLDARFVDLGPTSSRQCETEGMIMPDQPAFPSAEPSLSRNQITQSAASQSQKKHCVHKDSSFSSLRSQFLALPIGGRLQFLSWLFEGTLRQCVSTPTGFNLTATDERDHWLNENVINDLAVRDQHIEPMDVHHTLWDEGGPEVMQIHQIEYEVEKILQHKQSARGSVSYLVKWKGYDETEATWEPFDAVQDTAALEYYERQSGIVARGIHNSTAFSSSFCKGTKSKCSRSSVKKNTEARRKSATKRQRYSLEEDRLLVKLRHEQKLPWSEVYRRYNEKYPGRQESSVKVHWSTKIRKCLQ